MSVSIEAQWEGGVYRLRKSKWGDDYALFGPYHGAVGDYVPKVLLDAYADERQREPVRDLLRCVSGFAHELTEEQRASLACLLPKLGANPDELHFLRKS